jgi:hypothetical protein
VKTAKDPDPADLGQADAARTISTRRAYLEVLGVFLAFFGASVGYAIASLAGGLPVQTRLPWGESIPGSFDEIATAALAVVLTMLLCRSRGLPGTSLGWRLPTQDSYLRPTTRLLGAASCALLALLVGGAVTHALETGTNNLHPNSASDLLAGLAQAVNAGFLEESVVLAFVVITLEQAHRHDWEIGLVAVALRASYHVYYGPGVIGILIWAYAFLVIFRATRSIIALVSVHVVWDIFATLNSVFVHNAAAALAFLGVLLGIPGLALVRRRSDRRQFGTPAPTWPGAVESVRCEVTIHHAPWLERMHRELGGHRGLNPGDRLARPSCGVPGPFDARGPQLGRPPGGVARVMSHVLTMPRRCWGDGTTSHPRRTLSPSQRRLRRNYPFGYLIRA